VTRMRSLLTAALLCGPSGVFLGSTAASASLPLHVGGPLRGKTLVFKPGGMESNFDLLDRVVIATQLTSPGLGQVSLTFQGYLDNFQSDTQPALPDLIHPHHKLSQRLGGFFAGRALVLSARDRPLFEGSFLAEALIDLRCLVLPAKTKRVPAYCETEAQHFVAALQGVGAAANDRVGLRGTFVGNQQLQVTAGRVWGRCACSSPPVHKIHGAPEVRPEQLLRASPLADPSVESGALLLANRVGPAPPLGHQHLVAEIERIWRSVRSAERVTS